MFCISWVYVKLHNPRLPNAAGWNGGDCSLVANRRFFLGLICKAATACFETLISYSLLPRGLPFSEVSKPRATQKIELDTIGRVSSGIVLFSPWI